MAPGYGNLFVSVHGGHSGQFCGHAKDSLEEIVQAYIDKQFAWVGISEHMPAASAAFLYPEELSAGLSPADSLKRFADYIFTCRHLQRKYASKIPILVGFETEAHTGALEFAVQLKERFQPDYLVGSVHHVEDIPFDLNPQEYGRALVVAGGLEELYCRYFDRQYEMLQALLPAVVGHFDLIRIYDPDYGKQLALSAVQQRIERNLSFIKTHDLILDFNARALSKGASEPYVSAPILAKALSKGICVVPGDDSHGVETVGAGLAEAMKILKSMGADTRIRRPDAAKRG
jgi:histidinol-phosphatase (PHP family)